jgi:hypothetical protein
MKSWIRQGVALVAAAATSGLLGTAAATAADGPMTVSGLATWRTARGTPAPASGREAGLWANGASVSGTVTTTSSASRVVVTGRGSDCSGPAVLQVTVDGRAVGAVTLPSGPVYQDLPVGPEIAAGSHSVTATFINDRNTARCDRNAFVTDLSATSIQPDASTAGVPAGVTLQQVGPGDTVTATNGATFTISSSGRLSIPTSGVTISGYDIMGYVSIKADDVTVTRCRIRGADLGPVDSGRKNTRLYSSEGSGNLISYSEVAPDAYYVDTDGETYVDTRWIGLGGYGFTADHVDLSKAVDLLQTTGDNVTLTASYLHDNTQRAAGEDPWLRYAYPRYADDPSHSDGWQAEGGSNLVIRGNTFDTTPWTAFISTQNISKTDNIVIDGNWLGGGTCTVYILDNGHHRGPQENVTITNNVFTGVYPTSPYPGCHVLSTYQTRTTTHPGLLVSGNTSTDGYDPNKVTRGS